MTPTQEAVAAAYADALEIVDVGLDDDIFTLGGDSLHAVRVALKLQRIFDIEVPPELMEEPITVREAAEWIDSQLAEQVTP
jgi:acyl carrier protein